MLSGTCGSVAIKAEFGEFQQECTSRDTFRIGRRVRAELIEPTASPRNRCDQERRQSHT
jgi:hypothetical protein